jgi:tight adherence protein C
LIAAGLFAALAAIGGCAAAGELVDWLAVRLGGELRRRWRGTLSGRGPWRLGFSGRIALRARLEAAGQPAGLGSREWLMLKAALAGLAAGTATVAAAVSPSRFTLLLVLAAPVAGFVAPDAYLTRRASRRIDEAGRELPDMLDLLRVAVEAGMPPSRALGTVAAQFSGTLATEWRRASAEIALGAPADEALASVAERLPAEEIVSLVEALGRSRRHGVPLRQVLAAQSARARHRRRQKVREGAARAGPKIQLVVALLLVPSVLLMVAAAIVAELERSGLVLPGLIPRCCNGDCTPIFVLQSGREWAKVARSYTDRDGGAPPTPPSAVGKAGPAPQERERFANWRFVVSTSTRWTRRTG